ncbi:hypothetical protein [Massilia sp.]|uniref:hypothetical protein n=1 Tax=Massilia sp. TaxID=1882437 RepID=UPI00289AE9FC|nr:hypothetical protein [Massilia sp.]
MDTTNSSENPQRRVEDRKPAEVIDWAAPGAPAVPSSPAATPGIDEFMVYGSAGNRRVDLEAKLRDALAAEVSAPAATSGDAPADLQQIKALALAARDYIEQITGDVDYGFCRTTNPHDFTPDAKCCSADEIAAHRAACDAYDKGEYTPERGSEWVGATHILRAPWGIGTYTTRDEHATKIIAGLTDLIARIESAAAPQDAPAAFAKRYSELLCENRRIKAQVERASAPATASGDELPEPAGREALRLLAVMYDKYENGVQCYEDPEEGAGFMGTAVQLDSADECSCIELLNKYAPSDEVRAAVSAATKPTADLSSLQRWSASRKNLGAMMRDEDGSFYRAADVQPLLATKPAAAPEGYKLAPINPTPAMLEAARNAPLPMVRLDSMSAQQDLMNKSRYAAMLAASTTGAAQTAEQVRDQALEDAAKTAEATRVAQVQYGLSIFQDGDGTRKDIATAIRALKRPTPTHSSEAGDE